MFCETPRQKRIKRSSLSFRDILFDKDNWEIYQRENNPPLYLIKSVEKVKKCRTGELGNHYWYCENCGFGGKSPHSCKSKLCSSCATIATNNWLAEVLPTLLDIKYFQIVFTLPPKLYPLFVANKVKLYNLFFQTASQAILLSAAANKFLPGIIGVFHPFGAEYNIHPHIHFMATAGGLTPNHQGWFTAKWWPLELTRDTFKAILYKKLRKLMRAGELFNPYGSLAEFEALLQKLYPKEWNLFIGYKDERDKANYGLSYISRYAKRAIISDRKLICYDGELVTFQAKNKKITAKKDQFIREVLRHIMPPNFKTTRFYGLYANRKKKTLVPLAREFASVELIRAFREKESWRERRKKYSGQDPLLCPRCGKQLTLIAITHSTRIPEEWDGLLTLSTFDHFL
jgi:hypothetical protein